MTATIYRLAAAASAAGSRPQVFQVTATAASSRPTIYRLAAASSGAAVTPIVDPIPAQTLDGWETGSITAHATPTPDGWIFTALTEGVTLTGSGSVRTFTAPAAFDGTTVQVGVQASRAGVLSAHQIAQFTVKPWSSFVLVATGSSTSEVTDGGTATAPPTATIDGGTATAASTDLIDGNGAPTSTWLPRRPIQPILPPGFGLGPFGTMPFGGR